MKPLPLNPPPVSELSTARPTRSAFGRSWAVLLVFVVAAFGIGQMQPRAERKGPAASIAFSTERAWRHVEAIAAAPHPRGSEQNAIVRDYILAELEKLGVDAKVERALAPTSGKQARMPLPVENIVARLPGRTVGPAVMLSAHYDSASKSPGAGDNAAAVAALLEVTRALRAGDALRHDLLLVFTDGEETGMLGARAFLADRAAAPEIAVVLNFDARGTSGPSIMFETSPGNGPLLRALAHAGAPVVTSSLTQDVYRLMPNKTDFTVYREAGLRGLNFAFIGGGQHYHRPTDNLQHLDRRTLQHVGDQALALARYFANSAEPVEVGPDAVYFSVLPSFVCRYPASIVLPLTALLATLATGVSIVAIRRRALQLRGVAWAFALGVAAILVAAGIGWGVYHSRWLLPESERRTIMVLAIATGITGVVTVVLNGWRARRATPFEQAFATLVLLTSAAVACAFVAPGGSYLFYWPALLGWLGLAAVYPAFSVGRRGFWFLFASAAVAALLLAPMLSLLWQAIPPALPVVTAALALIVLLIPGRAGVPAPRR